MDMVSDTWHVSVTCRHVIYTWFTRDFVTPDPFELQTSVRGQNGVEFHQDSNGQRPRHMTRAHHVSTRDLHVIYAWFCNSWSLWATDKFERSKWGKISPGIQWAWSQTRDTCPSRVCHVSTRDFLTSDPFELQTSVRGQNGVEFHQESNGHGVRHIAHVHM